MKSFLYKVYNFIQREFAYSVQIDSSGKYIPYGPLDTLPNELNSLVEGSTTATSCLSTLTDFIAGEGFNLGEDLENLVLNPRGLKFSHFHNVCSDSLAHNWGVAAIVKYNAGGKITEVYDIPFGYCRLGEPDDKGIISKIKYNPYFGTELYKRQDTVEYDVYNTNAAPVQAAKDKKWKGQIFWVGIRTRKNPFYPVPDYYSAKHWMRVEKNAGVYFDENLENGFLNDTIMKMIGDPNDPSGQKTDDGEDIPKGEAFDTMMTQNFAGAKNRHRIMALWGNSKDEFPQLEAFPTAGNPDLFRVQDEHATKKITIATKVPAILANIAEGVSLGGDGNTIRASVKLMQQRVIRMQAILIDFYQEILKNLVNPVTEQLKITPYHPFPELERVDPQAWEVMTLEERRKYVKDHTEIELIELAPVQQQPAQPEVQNKLVALHFDSYPESAKKNAKRALEWQEKMNAKCVKTFASKISQSIIDGVPLGPADIRRLANFLSKNVLEKDKEWKESCVALQFYAWGGSEMMIWANDKVKELKG